MNLDESQSKQVAAWIEQGLKVGDIQKKLLTECGVSMIYMDVRLLIDDLKLKPKDPEPVKPSPLAAGAAPPAPAKGTTLANRGPLDPAGGVAGKNPAGQVQVSVDQLARPGAVVSGKVTFSDGNAARWQLDQFGRLGLVPETTGYKPPQSEIAEFQAQLQEELARLGY